MNVQLEKISQARKKETIKRMITHYNTLHPHQSHRDTLVCRRRSRCRECSTRSCTQTGPRYNSPHARRTFGRRAARCAPGYTSTAPVPARPADRRPRTLRCRCGRGLHRLSSIMAQKNINCRECRERLMLDGHKTKGFPQD